MDIYFKRLQTHCSNNKWKESVIIKSISLRKRLKKLHCIFPEVLILSVNPWCLTVQHARPELTWESNLKLNSLTAVFIDSVIGSILLCSFLLGQFYIWTIGCTECRGAITISKLSYWVHKFTFSLLRNCRGRHCEQCKKIMNHITLDIIHEAKFNSIRTRCG